jgi:hypothetical protein
LNNKKKNSHALSKGGMTVFWERRERRETGRTDIIIGRRQWTEEEVYIKITCVKCVECM